MVLVFDVENRENLMRMEENNNNLAKMEDKKNAVGMFRNENEGSFYPALEPYVHPPGYVQCLQIHGDPPPTSLAAQKRAKCIREIEELQMKVCEALTELCEKVGMPVTQENGQRRLGPPNDHTGPAPGKGCEVFVGKIPRDIFEPDLFPIFQKVGKIYELRLMMDFSGTNRGYCFVHFYSPDEANRAVRELNDYEIRKGRYIGVVKSVDNCRLFIGGLPKDKNEEDILKEIDRITQGVVRVIAYPSPADKTKNRGFAFVEYDSHKSAAMARRKMIPGKIPMWGVDVAVDWAEPEPNVQNLYVRNLMLETTEETLRDLFNEHSANGVDRVKKIKDYAFVHFVSREQAEQAKFSLENVTIDGAQIEITWAKPVNKAQYKQQKALSKEFYPSAGGRMNARGRSGLRNPQNYGNNISRSVFGAHHAPNYQGSGLLPLPPHFQDGTQLITQGMMQLQLQGIQPGAMGGSRSFTRHRAAAGVQGIRLPAHGHGQQHAYFQHHHHQPPSRQVMQYMNSMAQPTVMGDQYLNFYGIGFQPAANGPMFPYVPHTRVKQQVQDLFEMCVRFGWGEPTYNTEVIKTNSGTYYRGTCIIPNHPTGPKSSQGLDMYQDADDARASAADSMLRVTHAEVFAALEYQTTGQHMPHYAYPPGAAICPTAPAPVTN